MKRMVVRIPDYGFDLPDDQVRQILAEFLDQLYGDPLAVPAYREP